MARFIVLGVTPPVQLQTNDLPRVNRLLGEESGEPGVVKQSELVEVSPFVSHHPGVDVLEYPVGVRHARHLLSVGVIDFLKLLLAEFLRV